MMMIQTQFDMGIPFVGELPTVLRAVGYLQRATGCCWDGGARALAVSRATGSPLAKLARSTSTAHEFDHARGLNDVRDSIDAAFGAKRI